MKIIEKLSDQIEEEIDDAEKYAKCALNYKTERPQLSETYYRLANEELQHMNLLHVQIVNLIEEYKKPVGDPPKDMVILYDIIHKRYIEHAASVRGMLALYKEFN